MAKKTETVGVELLPQEVNVTIIDRDGLVKKAWSRSVQEGNTIDVFVKTMQELLGKNWKSNDIHLSIPMNSLSQNAITFNSQLENEAAGVDWFLDKYLGNTSSERVVDYDVKANAKGQKVIHISSLNPKEIDEFIGKFVEINFKPKTLIPEPVALLNTVEKQGALNAKSIVFKVNQHSSFWMLVENGAFVKMGNIEPSDAEYPNSLVEGFLHAINKLGLNTEADGVFFCGSKFKEPVLIEELKKQVPKGILIDLMSGNSKVDLSPDLIAGGAVSMVLALEGGN